MAQAMKNAEDYQAAYDIFRAIPKTNSYFKEGNKNAAELVQYLLHLHSLDAFELTPEELFTYKEGLFCCLLNAKENVQASRLLQHDIMMHDTMTLEIVELDGSPESYLLMADLFRKQQKELHQAREELRQLRVEKDLLERNESKSSQSFCAKSLSSSSSIFTLKEKTDLISVSAKEKLEDKESLYKETRIVHGNC